VRALFLDRDGVINHDRNDYVTSPDAFRFLPGALEALAAVAAKAFAVVVVTNQSAVGRGRLTTHMLDQIHARMLEDVRAAGGRIDAIYTCPHRPEASCVCRKPRTELLHRAASELGVELEVSYFVGDAASDVQAALAAGCQPLLVRTGRGLTARAELARNHIRDYWLAADLLQAVKLILARERPGEPRSAAICTCPRPDRASAGATAHWRMRRPPGPLLLESFSTISPDRDLNEGQ
jgi:D-glycero-D-manno-heptose 1,7-bisphosphate phosphatase